MTSHSEHYELLKRIIQIFTSSLPIEAKLDQVLQSISKPFGPDRCLFLRTDQIGKNGFLARLAQKKEPLWVENESSFPKEEILSQEKELLSPSFACIPIYDEISFHGILYLGFSVNRTFSPQDIDLLLLIAKEIGEALRYSHLQQKAEQTLSELTALHELGKAVTSALKLEDLFELIVKTGVKILKAKSAVLRVEDRKTGQLKVRYSLGGYDQGPYDEKVAKRVFFSHTPLLLNHSGEVHPSLSILSAPFLSKGRVLGTLTFYDKEVDPFTFTERDFQLLLTMTNHISFAIENGLTLYETSRMAQEHEKSVRRLSTLWELNKALLTTVHLERIIQMTLTAITIGNAFGFNRAMLFLVNEKEHFLQGIMAVGPDTAEEAGKIWNNLSRQKGSLSDLISRLPFSADSSLNAIVKEIRIPLDQEQCILSRTILQGRPFNVQPSQAEGSWVQTRCARGCHLSSEMGCYVGEHLGHDPRVDAFATVPLWGKGKVIGVILVDNLYNQNPITGEDIQFLSMFSNQAGLAIENGILYRNLEEVHQALKETQVFLAHQEKMAALGTLSSTIAHEIRTPLVSIGGFARRLYRTVSDEAPEKRYTQTIMIEVSRLEKILNDLLNYTREEAPVFKEVDLCEIVQESLSMVSEHLEDEGIKVIKEFADDLPMTIGDHPQLKQAFTNLFSNSLQAMNGKGTLSLRLRPISKNGSSFIQVEVEDSGNGIDPENLHNIFNPFYSTKETGLGLGLPLVYKIITSHQGQIEVDNRPGEGVTFIITLPAVTSKERKIGEVDR
jgi:two-component system sensor histidine kinase HydH